MRTFHIRVFLLTNVLDVSNIEMRVADIVKLSEHVEVSVVEYLRINELRPRMLLHLFSILSCYFDSLW